jgi:hypothetical protein
MTGKVIATSSAYLYTRYNAICRFCRDRGSRCRACRGRSMTQIKRSVLRHRQNQSPRADVMITETVTPFLHVSPDRFFGSKPTGTCL